LSFFIQNHMSGKLKSVCVKAPSFGHNKKAILQDIATMTGATMIDKDIGKDLTQVTLNDLGQSEKVVTSATSTTIIGGKGNDKLITDRVRVIKTQLEDVGTSEAELKRLEERYGVLSGGIAVIKVGAPTEAEMREKMLRVEDAINATKAAVEEGIVIGGGITLLRISEKATTKIMKRVLQAPFKKIMNNAGVSKRIQRNIIKLILSGRVPKNWGFDIMKMQMCNLATAGVIDPTKVETASLRNAMSASVMVLTTDCLIVEAEEEKRG